jgi:hypothetical protein
VKADDLRLENKGVSQEVTRSAFFCHLSTFAGKAGQKGKSQNEPEQPEKQR